MSYVYILNKLYPMLVVFCARAFYFLRNIYNEGNVLSKDNKLTKYILLFITCYSDWWAKNYCLGICFCTKNWPTVIKQLLSILFISLVFLYVSTTIMCILLLCKLNMRNCLSILKKIYKFGLCPKDVILLICLYLPSVSYLYNYDTSTELSLERLPILFDNFSFTTFKSL